MNSNWISTKERRERPAGPISAVEDGTLPGRGRRYDRPSPVLPTSRPSATFHPSSTIPRFRRVSAVVGNSPSWCHSRLSFVFPKTNRKKSPREKTNRVPFDQDAIRLEYQGGVFAKNPFGPRQAGRSGNVSSICPQPLPRVQANCAKSHTTSRNRRVSYAW